jgi:hypothetical protein
MFEKIKNRWKVNTPGFVLIICTFALGGSLCGYLGRRLIGLLNLEKGFWWVCLYLLIIALLWPICVILISIPLGQYPFFKAYLKKIWAKIKY